MKKLLSGWTTVALLTLATVLVPAVANAGLCANCAGKSFIANIGKCNGCGAATASGAFSLCPACSTARNQCEACGGALTAAKQFAPPLAASTPVVRPPANPIEIPGMAPAAVVTPDETPVAATTPVVRPPANPIEIPGMAVPAAAGTPTDKPAAVEAVEK